MTLIKKIVIGGGIGRYENSVLTFEPGLNILCPSSRVSVSVLYSLFGNHSSLRHPEHLDVRYLGEKEGKDFQLHFLSQEDILLSECFCGSEEHDEEVWEKILGSPGMFTSLSNHTRTLFGHGKVSYHTSKIEAIDMELLESSFLSCFPSITKLSFRPVENRQNYHQVVFEYRGGKEERVEKHLAEFEKLILLEKLVALCSTQGSIVAMFSPPPSIHIDTLRLYGLAIQSIVKKRGLQLLLFTRCPYFLDAFDENIEKVSIITETDDGKHILQAKLSERPDFDWAKRSLTLGEMYSCDDESWVGEESAPPLEEELQGYKDWGKETGDLRYIQAE